MKGKVGVYGRSLGGIGTSYLTKYVDMVIIDRSFGNLHSVAETKFFGKIATTLFKFATGGWRANSDHHILTTVRDPKYGCQPEPCYKVITCDKNDEIIDCHSSLMVGAAKVFCQKHGDYRFLTSHESQQLIGAIHSLLSAEEVLFKFISLRAHREIERDTIGAARQNSISNTIEFSQKKRSKSED